MIPQELTEHMTLVKALTELLARIREGDLLPPARAGMTPGERFAVRFDGEVAAWVSMPHPSKTARVKDPEAFTAWVRDMLPEEVVEVPVVREGTQKQLLKMVAEKGGWLDENSGKRVPIPGVEVVKGEPTPRVELEDAALELIGAAVRSGDIDLTGFLALPAAADPGPEEAKAA